ncbi:MAG: hypothetical protein OJF50_006717 [Nitrospira sp.]|nr:hypothetical protein [Nitrospira sp.]
MLLGGHQNSRTGSNAPGGTRTYTGVLRRIGGTVEKNMKWLLKFAELDIRGLDEQALRLVREEASAFALLGSAFPVVNATAWAAKVTLPNRLVFVDIEWFHSNVRKAINELLEKNRTILPEMTVSIHLLRDSFYKRGTPFPFCMAMNSESAGHQGVDRPHTFLFRLAYILNECASTGRLVTCDACSKPIFKRHKKQQYCGNRCRSRINMATMREKEKLRREKVASKRQASDRKRPAQGRQKAVMFGKGSEEGNSESRR